MPHLTTMHPVPSLCAMSAALCQHPDALCVMGQEEVRMPLTNGEGPIGLIICPSRELARQVVACLGIHVHAPLVFRLLPHTR